MTTARIYTVIIPLYNERTLKCAFTGYIVSNSCDMVAPAMELTAAYERTVNASRVHRRNIALRWYNTWQACS